MTSLNKKFIAWGYKPGTRKDTFGYIHAAFCKAFQFMGYDVLHMDKDDDVSNISFENAIFFTHGPVDKNIPLIKTAKYILHQCDEEKYQNVDYIKYQVYTSGKENCYGFSGKKMDEYVYYNEKTKDLFMPWATELLPIEIEEEFKYNNNKRCIFVGTRCQGYHGNLSEWSALQSSCYQYGYNFEHYPPFSFSMEDNRRVINQSEIAPAILGRWQNINEMVPCRVFKNISYGKLGITNSATAYHLLEGNAIFNEPHLLLEEYLNTDRKKQKKMFENSVKIIKDNHTYVNRVQRLIKTLNDI